MKNILNDFDQTVKEQEEALNKSILEADGEEKEIDAETTEEADKEVEADKEEVEEDKETTETEAETEVDVKEDEVESDGEDEDVEEDVEEEKATKSVEPVSKATDDKEDVEADKKKKKDKKKIPKKPEASEDEEEDDEGAEGNSKKKPEKVKKSSEEDLTGLLEVVLKSYELSVKAQSELKVEISSLKNDIDVLAKSLATKAESIEVEQTEAMSKSLDLSEKTVEDKAVGYVTKNENVADADAVVAVTDQTDVETTVEEQEAPIFDVATEREPFLAKFQKEAQLSNYNRGEKEEIRLSYLKAQNGTASERELQTLRNFMG